MGRRPNTPPYLHTHRTVTSADPEPESGGVKCWVSYLANGMEFDTTTCTLSWTPTAPVGTSYTVKFGLSTASGGSDAALAIFTIVSGLLAGGGAPKDEEQVIVLGGANPVVGRFELRMPDGVRDPATLTVYDVAGRVVATASSGHGDPLVWPCTGRSGERVRAGLYFYRAEAGGVLLKRGKVVVLGR